MLVYDSYGDYAGLYNGAYSVSQPRPAHRAIKDSAGNLWPVLVHDWNAMPNIVHNILNDHLGYNAAGVHVGGASGASGSPGLIYIQRIDNIGFTATDEILDNFVNHLEKTTSLIGEDNRKDACGDSYGASYTLEEGICSDPTDPRGTRPEFWQITTLKS
ncbi:hypothetical protein BGZ76_008344 [Entomortierella beljakovae]|nr:hypothetical protein BGZ76_008344 [Entomortierella beljakovae]